MYQECPQCDAMISLTRKVCKCGFSFEKEKKHRRERGPCETPYGHCKNRAEFPCTLNNGKSVRVCEAHYDELRPKSPLDKKLEFLVERFRQAYAQEKRQNTGAFSIKNFMRKYNVF